MERTQITAAVIRELSRLLKQGMDHTAIADHLKISPYVVGVVANDKIGKGRRPRRDKHDYRAENNHQGVDAATIRMIRRMLQVGQLRYVHIAREAGVSIGIVEDVVAGRRLPVSTERPFVFTDLGERLVEESVRCSGCGAMLAVVPCRACRARGLAMTGTAV
jgi:hypothetical protein